MDMSGIHPATGLLVEDRLLAQSVVLQTAQRTSRKGDPDFLHISTKA